MFSGTATDDLAVTNVRVAIRDVADQQWWNGTAWQATPVQFEATLTAPGTTSTAWSYAWTPPAAGTYAVQVTAVDAAGKVDPSKPYVQFSYSAGVADTANPNGLVSSPEQPTGASPRSPITSPAPPPTTSAVTNVRVALRNVTGTNQ